MFNVNFDENGKIYMIKDDVEKYLLDENGNLKTYQDEKNEEKYVSVIQKIIRDYGECYHSICLVPYEEDSFAFTSKDVKKENISKYDHIINDDEQIIVEIPMKTGNMATYFCNTLSSNFYFDETVFTKEDLKNDYAYLRKINPNAFEIDMNKLLTMYSDEILENIARYYVTAFHWKGTKFERK